ncbi:hypothetical protein ACSBR1_012892 [Camellia fascicularis]
MLVSRSALPRDGSIAVVIGTFRYLAGGKGFDAPHPYIVKFNQTEFRSQYQLTFLNFYYEDMEQWHCTSRTCFEM